MADNDTNRRKNRVGHPYKIVQFEQEGKSNRTIERNDRGVFSSLKKAHAEARKLTDFYQRQRESEYAGTHMKQRARHVPVFHMVKKITNKIKGKGGMLGLASAVGTAVAAAQKEMEKK